jgi:hypothetical protein
MTKFNARTSAYMEVVLDEAFAVLPHGGDHESRKFVAEKLIQSARNGNVTLQGLRAVGQDAFRQVSIWGLTWEPCTLSAKARNSISLPSNSR